jgi:microcystin-dependent protein
MDGTLGEIRTFAGNYVPDNWVLCDGRKLSVNDFAALYSLLGTAFGGNGTVDFAVPNLCGRTVIKTGTGTGLSPYAYAQQGGTEGVTLTGANLPAHTHVVSVSTTDSNTDQPTNNHWGGFLDKNNPTYEVRSYLPNNPVDPDQKLIPLNEGTISASGGGNQAHENRMPFMAMNYIICTIGLYPDLQ